jgi:hypothetical protein
VALRPASIATGSAGIMKVRAKVTMVTPIRIMTDATSRLAI